MDFQELLQYFLRSLAGVFVIVNPITTAFAFVALTHNYTLHERKATAQKASVVATFILVLFALSGNVIFQLFGITLYSFRIAGASYFLE